MREVMAAAATVAIAVALAACAEAPPEDLELASDSLPAAAATASPDVSASPDPTPTASASVDPESATPLASIRRGPVRASIEAVRESDGAAMGVQVDTPRAIEGDPLVTADCGDPSGEQGFTVVVQDLAVEEGIDTATVGIANGVSSPGTYDGVVTFLDSDGHAIRGAGTVVVSADFESGTFDVSDPDSGDHFIGVWECRAL